MFQVVHWCDVTVGGKRMADLWNNVLGQQYEAALGTLNYCIEHSPEAAWQGKVVRMTFDLVVFHSCFSPTSTWGQIPRPSSSRPTTGSMPSSLRTMKRCSRASRSSVTPKRRCLIICISAKRRRKKRSTRKPPDDLAAACQFPRKTFSRAELHVYNVRHIQHHAAQLIMRLRLDHQVDTPWFGSGWPS